MAELNGRHIFYDHMSDYACEENKLTSSLYSCEKSKSIEHIHNKYIVILLEMERILFHSVFLS